MMPLASEQNQILDAKAKEKKMDERIKQKVVGTESWLNMFAK